jgi:hypothetical protein
VARAYLDAFGRKQSDRLEKQAVAELERVRQKYESSENPEVREALRTQFPIAIAEARRRYARSKTERLREAQSLRNALVPSTFFSVGVSALAVAYAHSYRRQSSTVSGGRKRGPVESRRGLEAYRPGHVPAHQRHLAEPAAAADARCSAAADRSRRAVRPLAGGPDEGVSASWAVAALSTPFVTGGEAEIPPAEARSPFGLDSCHPSHPFVNSARNLPDRLPPVRASWLATRPAGTIAEPSSW